MTVLDDLTMAAPKTKDVVTALKALGLSEKTVLLTTATHDPVVYKSARNIEGVSILPASDLNTYEVLAKRQFVVTKSALDKLVGKAV